MNLLAFCAILWGVAVSASAQCRLTRFVVENETRIFAVGNPHRYELLHSDNVPTGRALYMLCPGGTPLAIPTVCGADGQFSPPLPIRNCAGPVRASVDLTSDSSCSQQAYRVGYKVNSQFLELYRACYNQRDVSALQATHNVYAYTIAISRPEAVFTTDGVISGADAATFRREHIYRRFNELLGSRQRYIASSRATVISRGHLIPSADYLFFDNMRATFKYINAVPQFQSINVGNWKRIENWVRRHVESVPSATVTTGAHDVLQLRAADNALVPLYLGANGRNPIPKWMYKIVRDARDSYVFLVHNNIFDTPEPFSGTCRDIGCPAGIDLNNTPQAGITICCDAATFAL